MTGQTEVEHAGIDDASNRLDSSSDHSTNSLEQIEQVSNRQNGPKWPNMRETFGAQRRTHTLSQEIGKTVDQIIEAIKMFKSNIEATREDFVNTDQAGSANITEQNNQFLEQNFDQYSDGQHDETNAKNRAAGEAMNNILNSIYPGQHNFDVTPKPQVAEPVPAPNGDPLAAPGSGDATDTSSGGASSTPSGNPNFDTPSGTPEDTDEPR